MTTKKTTLKSVFLTGLLVLVPLAITLWVLGLVIGTMDQTLLAAAGVVATRARCSVSICRVSARC